MKKSELRQLIKECLAQASNNKKKLVKEGQVEQYDLQGIVLQLI